MCLNNVDEYCSKLLALLLKRIEMILHDFTYSEVVTASQPCAGRSPAPVKILFREESVCRVSGTC